MPLPFQKPPSLASFKSRLVLPFWYWLTQAVLEKRPLNGCSSSDKPIIWLQICCKLWKAGAIFQMQEKIYFWRCRKEFFSAVCLLFCLSICIPACVSVCLLPYMPACSTCQCSRTDLGVFLNIQMNLLIILPTSQQWNCNHNIAVTHSVNSYTAEKKHTPIILY